MYHENYEDVVHQIESIGCKFRTPRDLPLKVDEGRQTCGKGGKYWYRLYTFSPTGSNRSFIVGAFGHYGKQSFKVDWDRQGLSAETREQYVREQAAAREKEQREAEQAAAMAALTAVELWARMSRTGTSEYLQRKGVEPEACRFVIEWLRIRRRDPREKPITIPPGTLVLPLIRYDLPREEALRGLQFIKPDGFKLFTENFGKNGCSVRLGAVDEWTEILLACEGYATGLSIRMATERKWPAFVCLDAGNLAKVVPLLRALYPNAFILVCADDDWKTANHDGRTRAARRRARSREQVERCEIVWPVFDPRQRGEKDTDFNDLHVLQGLDVVERQLSGVIRHVRSREFGAAECDGV
jgi:putative DNA primase/helicase